MMPGLTKEALAERREAVARMTRQGQSASQIAVQLGITKRSVVRHRRVAGVSGKHCSTPIPEEDLAFAKSILDEGASYSEAAASIGRSYKILAQKFPGYGWTRSQAIEYRWLNQRLRELKPAT